MARIPTAGIPMRCAFPRAPKRTSKRRDFTINGMLLDPLKLRETGDIDGAVLDFVGGRADLKAGIVRAIGDPRLRFEEDKLRMLRGVRFAARFGFAIEERTAAAIRALAGEIHQVSRERVRDELTHMLTEGHARRAFELLDATGLLQQVLPEVAKMHGVEQPAEFHPEGDVWVHTLLLLEKLPPDASPALAWGALLHDVGKPATFRRAPDRIRFDGHVEVGVRIAEEILRRLRFSLEETAQIISLIENHMRFGDVHKMKESTLKRFFRLPKFEEHLALHRMDALSSFGNLDNYEFAKEKYEALPEEQVRPPVAGDWARFDRSRISARAAIQRDAGAGRRCAVGGADWNARRRDGAGEGSVLTCEAIDSARLPLRWPMPTGN